MEKILKTWQIQRCSKGNTSRKTILLRIRSMHSSGPTKFIFIPNPRQTNGYTHLNAGNVWLCGRGGLCIPYFNHIPANSASSHQKPLPIPAHDRKVARGTLEAGYYLCQCDLGRKKLWEAVYVQILGDAHICAQTGSCMHMDLHRCSIWLSTGHLWRANLFQSLHDIIKHKLALGSQARLWGQEELVI